MSLKELREKISTIRNQVEEINTEAYELWVLLEGRDAEEVDDFRDNLDQIEALLSELEPE